MAEFRILRNKEGKIYWLFHKSGNDKIIAKSWEEYDSLSDCMFDIEVLRDQVKFSEINDDIKTKEVKKKKGFLFFKSLKSKGNR